MELLISILVGLLMVEVYVWLPKISEWLLECAIRQLPSSEQTRYREEWHANLNDFPNSAAKLVHALSHVVRAERANRQLLEADLDDIVRARNEAATKLNLNWQKLTNAVASQERRLTQTKTNIAELSAVLAEKLDDQTKIEKWDAFFAAHLRAAAGFHEATKEEVNRWTKTVEQMNAALEALKREAEAIRSANFFFTRRVDPAVIESLRKGTAALVELKPSSRFSQAHSNYMDNQKRFQSVLDAIRQAATGKPSHQS